MRYTVNVTADGTCWYQEETDIVHREDGPAVEKSNGTKVWHINGKLHRVDGPAYERANGPKYWYFEGMLHREGGPAIEMPDGSKYWYIHGESLTEQQFLERTAPAKELTIAEIEQLLGHQVKIVK